MLTQVIWQLTDFFRYGHSNCGNFQALMKKNFEIFKSFDVELLYRDPALARSNKGGRLDFIARWLTGDKTPATDK